MKRIFFIILFILLFNGISSANPQAFLTMLGGPEGYDYDYPGIGWTDQNCASNCYENHNCELFESPCVYINVGDAPISGAFDVNALFEYCQKTEEEGAGYCAPNCNVHTPKLQYDNDQWEPQGAWRNPLFKEEAWSPFNEYPLYLNTLGGKTICGTSGLTEPDEWYWFLPVADLLVVWYDGNSWEPAYTPGEGQWSNFDYVQPGEWWGYLTPEWVGTFKSRFLSQSWRLKRTETTGVCTCHPGYPGKLAVGANGDVILDTFGDLWGWNDEVSTGAGVVSIVNHRLFMDSDPNNTPAVGDMAKVYWPGEVGYYPSEDLFMVTYRIKHDSIGNVFEEGYKPDANYTTENYFIFHFNIIPEVAFVVYHGADGVFFIDSSAGINFNEIGSNANLICPGGVATGCIQEWTFRVSLNGHADQAAYTADVWRNGIKIAEDVNWAWGGDGDAGSANIYQYGHSVTGRTTVDFITVGNDFEAGSVP